MASALQDTLVDLSDPRSFVDGVPHGVFDRLRREAPVHWTPTDWGTPSGGFWSLTRHDDVVAVSQDQEDFTSALGAMFPSCPDTVALQRGAMIMRDPPDHTRLRLLTARGFGRRAVGRLEDWVRELAVPLVEGLWRRDTLDFVAEVAAVLPARVIGALLGVPDADLDNMVRWAHAMVFGGADADGVDAAHQAALEAFEYADWLRDRKLRHPEADVMTELAMADVDGERLRAEDYNAYFLLLVTAGIESTHTLLGQAVRLALEEPGVERQIRAAATARRMDGVVEELLRHVSPVMHMARHARRDVRLRDRTIAAGDMVLLWYVAANRDPEVFPDPHRFDSERRQPHVAFGGGGPHYCLGSHLARLETRVLLEELFTRGPRLEPAGPPRRGWSVFANHLRELPVRVRPA
ncbi:cholest-4-en-3-one 26-monooxygenase [Streptoalloteichus tenebrarius]|uniref:Cholest-4-en-3-one 26-monooxygenase n=1 Tax=Streptoalloteichus tenebrarius (strain ATCC 17920 / DSM 40477 / JCM 4838 / CBS 697.72 / NBRC 16177 / NCIMB 11028 / NRRL B-12390 / A12253. 1 / ISP 5477) TaxID=1933 RepID=A0ABT1HSM0_STRSD|nr:cytochrome P450 [Streptoalloteichus tenebrarius]MCP2258521.1 cholest-4-en-3-one 26-monooxygenase [Streptoalloteichus tenebrarius]BFF04116.1 cytochrome P450 [Streptoalloteichus tenebrarius]